MMQTFSILTRGCKVNQYESQQIRQLLETFGLTQVDTAESPQLVVINTCCVTHTASAKSRHLIRQAQKHGPEAVVVCGCLPTVETDELKALGENVHVVKDRCDLTATLRCLVAAQATTQDAQSSKCFDPSIRAENDDKVKSKNDLQSPEDANSRFPCYEV